MSTKEQEKIIKELRSKVVKVDLGELSSRQTKIDEAAVWAQAKHVGKTIDEDAISAHDITRS